VHHPSCEVQCDCQVFSRNLNISQPFCVHQQTAISDAQLPVLLLASMLL